MSKDDLWEKTIHSQRIYNGKIINLRKDEVTLPDGGKSSREIVEHPGAVVILAVNNLNQVMMVRQFRKAVDNVLLELPAGTLEPSEKLISCARRELEEETGFQARKWGQIFNFYSSPGFCNESLTLFFAQDLIKTVPNTDHDEFIEVITLDKERVQKLLRKGKIRDAKTLIGILWWLNQ